jgi:hypothetical protein
MGAWKGLTEAHRRLFQELEQALAQVQDGEIDHSKEDAVSILHQKLNEQLERLGWRIGIQISLTGARRTFYTLDFLKDKIGGKLVLGKQAFVLSSLLANFPLSIQIHDMDLGIVLVPMRSLKQRLPKGVSDFESTYKVLEELSPLLIRYPFLILGFSDDPSPQDVTELTSDLDQFLLNQVGYTLSEMVVMGERPEYDFKIHLPQRIESITKEVCALANLQGGGVLLFGIKDNGEIKGIQADELDISQLRITNSVRNLCEPIPSFEFYSFEIPDDPERMILVCQVEEQKRKPCLVHSRAYVRSGPSAQPADAEEIRRMVLSSAQE